MLPASIQVCPIELPGRGRRRDEVGIPDVATLADALSEGLPLQVPPPPPCGIGDGLPCLGNLSSYTFVSGPA